MFSCCWRCWCTSRMYLWLWFLWLWRWWNTTVCLLLIRKICIIYSCRGKIRRDWISSLLLKRLLNLFLRFLVCWSMLRRWLCIILDYWRYSYLLSNYLPIKWRKLWSKVIISKISYLCCLNGLIYLLFINRLKELFLLCFAQKEVYARVTGNISFVMLWSSRRQLVNVWREWTK